MTKEETGQVLSMMQAAYPRAFKDMSKDSLIATVGLWYDLLGEYHINVVKQAIRALIAENMTNFAPPIGQVLDKVKKKDIDCNRSAERMYFSFRQSAYDEYGRQAIAERYNFMPEEYRQIVDALGCRHKNSVTKEEFLRGYKAVMLESGCDR